MDPCAGGWIVDNRAVKVLVFVVLCIIWGSSWVGIKYSHTGFPPFYGAALRFGIAAILLSIYCKGRGRSLEVPRRLWKPLLVSGLITYLVDYGLVYWAESHLSAGMTAVLFGTHPLFMAIVSMLFFRLEMFRGSIVLGLLFGFSGVAIIFSRDLLSANWHSEMAAGGAAVLLSAIGAAVGTAVMKKHLGGLEPAVLCLYQMVIGTIGLGLMGFLVGETLVTPIPPQAIIAVVYLAVTASAVAFTLYVWLLHSADATTVSLIVYFTPVTALLIDWGLLGQVPSASMLAGVLLILAGVAVSELPRYRRALKLRVSESE